MHGDASSYVPVAIARICHKYVSWTHPFAMNVWHCCVGREKVRNLQGSGLVRTVGLCGHRDAFSNEWRKVPRISMRLTEQAPSLKQSERRGLFFIMLVNSLVVDSLFEQSKNIAITCFLVMSLISCY